MNGKTVHWLPKGTRDSHIIYFLYAPISPYKKGDQPKVEDIKYFM